MPTITISSPPLPIPRRRAVALRLTRWLSDSGVEPGHVVVRFETPEEATVFSGGLPLEALPHDGTGIHHASVTCCVGPNRDEEFRAGLARCIAEALGAGDGTPFFYLEFRPTSPADVHLGGGRRLHRADRPPRPEPAP
ncbi:hypothetical protein [Streptomyces caatingaensis]|uniref:4-oxalocrotonate tautomerase domain-containing protein n=1 Tax=Streptomyces caatingaensis TaxID=1678637 RepID=A0A0K9XAM3_9ACTN|nr:hypothetical protein [Streptomyces caatingaensis]KNB50248.1 hypothetical protein AC230_26645 [Streptomyces caatingaensis]